MERQTGVGKRKRFIILTGPRRERHIHHTKGGVGGVSREWAQPNRWGAEGQ